MPKKKKFLPRQLARGVIKKAAAEYNPALSFPVVLFTFLDAPELLTTKKSSTPLRIHSQLKPILENLEIFPDKEFKGADYESVVGRLEDAAQKLFYHLDEYNTLKQFPADAERIKKNITNALRDVLSMGMSQQTMTRMQINDIVKNPNWLSQLTAVYDKFMHLRSNNELSEVASNFNKIGRPTLAESKDAVERNMKQENNNDFFGLDKATPKPLVDKTPKATPKPQVDPLLRAKNTAEQERLFGTGKPTTSATPAEIKPPVQKVEEKKSTQDTIKNVFGNLGGGIRERAAAARAQQEADKAAALKASQEAKEAERQKTAEQVRESRSAPWEPLKSEIVKPTVSEPTPQQSNTTINVQPKVKPDVQPDARGRYDVNRQQRSSSIPPINKASASNSSAPSPVSNTENSSTKTASTPTASPPTTPFEPAKPTSSKLTGKLTELRNNQNSSDDKTAEMKAARLAELEQIKLARLQNNAQATFANNNSPTPPADAVTQKQKTTTAPPTPDAKYADTSLNDELKKLRETRNGKVANQINEINQNATTTNNNAPKNSDTIIVNNSAPKTPDQIAAARTAKSAQPKNNEADVSYAGLNNLFTQPDAKYSGTSVNDELKELRENLKGNVAGKKAAIENETPKPAAATNDTPKNSDTTIVNNNAPPTPDQIAATRTARAAIPKNENDDFSVGNLYDQEPAAPAATSQTTNEPAPPPITETILPPPIAVTADDKKNDEPAPITPAATTETILPPPIPVAPIITTVTAEDKKEEAKDEVILNKEEDENELKKEEPAVPDPIKTAGDVPDLSTITPPVMPARPIPVSSSILTAATPTASATPASNGLLTNWDMNLADGVIQLARAANDSSALSNTKAQMEFFRLKSLEFKVGNFENLAEREKLSAEWLQTIKPLAQQIAENTARLSAAKDNLPNCANYLKTQSWTMLKTREANSLLTQSHKNLATYEEMWKQLKSIEHNITQTSDAQYQDRVRFSGAKVVKFAIDPNNPSSTNSEIAKQYSAVSNELGLQKNNPALAMRTASREEQKVDMKNEAVIVALKGNGSGKPSPLSKIDLDLNTVFSVAPLNGRGDFGLSMYQLREDLSAPHVMAKMIIDGTSKLQDLKKYFPEIQDPNNLQQTKNDLVKLFQQISPQPSLQEITALLCRPVPPGTPALNNWFSPNIGQLANALNKAVTNATCDPKNSAIPNQEIMMIAKEWVESLRNGAEPKPQLDANGRALPPERATPLILESSCPPLMKMAISLYCDAKAKATNDPIIKSRYAYYDPLDRDATLHKEHLKKFSINPVTIFEQFSASRKIAATNSVLNQADNTIDPFKFQKEVSNKDQTKIHNLHVTATRDQRNTGQLQRKLEKIDLKLQQTLSDPDVKTKIEEQIAAKRR